ncbi:MAG: hypothetical protein R8K22_08975 [Mariprofundaceae bacterium]
MRQEAEQELIQSGSVSADDIHTAKMKSRSNHISILLNLLKGRSNENCKEITKILAQHYKIPFLSLNRITPPHQMLSACDAAQARKIYFLPIAEHGDHAVVGMVDPLDLNYDNEVRAIFQKPIESVFISLDDFERNYYRLFRQGITPPAENLQLMNTVALKQALLSSSQSVA